MPKTEKQLLIIKCYERCRQDKALLAYLHSLKKQQLNELYNCKLSNQLYGARTTKCPSVGVYSFVEKQARRKLCLEYGLVNPIMNI
jgi:hypothetical protein